MRRLSLSAGLMFVLAWIAGLAVAGSGGPKPGDSKAAIAAFFAAHERSALLEHLLIDGVAGVALIAVAFVIRRRIGSRAGFVAGLGAGAVSLVQMLVGEAMAYDAAHGGAPGAVRALFVTLNDADTVKLALLGAMIGAVTVSGRRAGVLPGWFTRASGVFAPLLALSGLAFPLESDALYASLAVTLIGLLAWVLGFAVLVGRRERGQAFDARKRRGYRLMML
jgi:hypothetical protein